MEISRLPYADKAYVSPRKIFGYLLSETHAVGKSKAKFFRMFGYTEQTSEQLRDGLLTIARTESVVEIIPTIYGRKYIIDGPLQTPQGRMVWVRTVWIFETDDTIPRFVTARPYER